jgi:hypothetical protein
VEEGEGHVQLPQNLGGDSWPAFKDSWPEFRGVEGHSHSSRKENAYGNMEWSDGGELRDGSGIRHVYWDETWKQEYFTYDPKPHDFDRESEPNIF